MSPKARTTVKPFSVRPEASPTELAHARGLNEGMLRKVNRIKQEITARETLARKLVKKIGLRNKRIAELEAELRVYQMNHEGAQELEAETADALDQIARGLPGYSRPRHNPNCASCIIGEAIRAIASHTLGVDHPLARQLPNLSPGMFGAALNKEVASAK